MVLGAGDTVYTPAVTFPAAQGPRQLPPARPCPAHKPHRSFVTKDEEKQTHSFSFEQESQSCVVSVTPF